MDKLAIAIKELENLREDGYLTSAIAIPTLVFLKELKRHKSAEGQGGGTTITDIT